MERVNTSLIQTKMTEKKLTLQEMAETLGYKNASSFFKFLRGDYEFRAYHIPILMKKLDITLDELFFEDNFAETAK